MIKNIFIALFISICFNAKVFAQDAVQDTRAFEGEIVFETYEVYSDMMKKGSNILFDGVHKKRLILKGSKAHLIDETTKCHYINDAGSIISSIRNNSSIDYDGDMLLYCDITKNGSKFPKDMQLFSLMASNVKEMTMGKGFLKISSVLSSYTFSKTNKTQNILGHDCTLYEGKVSRTLLGMESPMEISAYVSDIPAPDGYIHINGGLDVPGLMMKFIEKSGATTGLGEFSSYIETDVLEVIQRKVSDDEFEAPADYKIAKKIKGSDFNEMQKQIYQSLIKQGIKGGDKSTKTTGVHYKTEGEWDF